jgi:hypothetical protein
MALPLSEEVLRALQNPVPLHEAVLAKHAAESPYRRLRAPIYRPHATSPCNLAEILLGGWGLARITPICRPAGMEAPLLV